MDLVMGAFFAPPSKRQMRGARWLDFLRGRSFFCLMQPLGSCESQGPDKQLAIRPSWVRVLAFNRAREPMPPSRRGALGGSTAGATGGCEYIGSDEKRRKYCERGATTS